MADKDAVAAVVAILSESPAVERCFGGGLPTKEAGSMPRAAVVVRDAGGGSLAAGYLPTVDGRLDVSCYGATEWEAKQLAGAVNRILHHLKPTSTDYGRVLWCKHGGGPSDLAAPGTGWPLVLTTWQVYGDWLAPPD